MKFKIDRAFYARVFAVAAPIIVQQFITNFVSMLDNVNRILDRVSVYLG